MAGLVLLMAACTGGERAPGHAADGAGSSRVTADDSLVPPPDSIAGVSMEAPNPDWLIVPNDRIGPVTASSSEADLHATLADSALVPGEIYLAEGVCTDGDILYPGAADQLNIAWADSARTHPAFLQVAGTGSRWSTDSGIRVGTTLKELETIRGEAITFSGFGWDYGGGLNWGGPDAPYRMSLRLQPDSASWQIAYQDPAVDDIFGDRPVRSDNPLIRRLNITVTSISVGFAAQFEEHDCRQLPHSP